MVYYFTSNVVSPAAFIYVGKDKVESRLRYVEFLLAILTDRDRDEDLIKYGFEEDVW